MKPIISIKNVKKSFRKEKDRSIEYKILKNINIDIYQGEIVAILGKTGSGKTTFSLVYS